MTRITHINLARRGIGQYGAALAAGLHQSEPTALNMLRNSGAKSPVMQKLTSRSSPRLLSDAPAPILALQVLLQTLRSRPDIIHDSAGLASFTTAWLLPLFRTIAPVVVTLHDPAPHVGWNRGLSARLTQRFIRNASSLWVHGPRSRQVLLDQGVDPDRIVIRPMGSFEFLLEGAPAAPNNRPYDVLFFGALRPNKGVHLLPSIVERIHHKIPEAQILIAGAAPARTERSWQQGLKEVLQQLRRLPNVTVRLGEVPDDEVADLFFASKTTLLPYVGASQSAIPMIAMPAESVVVATAVGDLPELIEHRRTGLLCSVDVRSLADAVTELLNDDRMRATLAAAAQERVRAQHDWATIARENLPLYESLLR